MRKTTWAMIFLCVGCASAPRQQMTYVQKFDSGYTYDKAVAQCEYEVNLQERADSRADSNSVIVTMIMSNATRESCMKRFGFVQVPVDGIEIQNRKTAQEQNEQNIKKFQEKRIASLNDYSKKAESICNDPTNAIYYSKTTCSVSNLTMEQLSDESKVTKKEQENLTKIRNEFTKLSTSFVQELKKSNDKQDKLLVDVLEKTELELMKVTLSLYQSKITWGEYNMQRKVLGMKLNEDLKKALAQ